MTVAARQRLTAEELCMLILIIKPSSHPHGNEAASLECHWPHFSLFVLPIKHHYEKVEAKLTEMTSFQIKCFLSALCQLNVTHLYTILWSWRN